MKEIPLTQGKVALVDDEDFEMLSKFKWHTRKDARAGGKGYVIFYASRTVSHNVHMDMHRTLFPHWKTIDHKDCDGLNNQRNNLRECSFSQNMANRRKTSIETTSKYKGVCWYKHRNCFRSQISINNKIIHLGYSAFEIVMARVYDYWAKHFHGEFARLNNV